MKYNTIQYSTMFKGKFKGMFNGIINVMFNCIFKRMSNAFFKVKNQ